jgi:hypothetical protein
LLNSQTCENTEISLCFFLLPTVLPATAHDCLKLSHRHGRRGAYRRAPASCHGHCGTRGDELRPSYGVTRAIQLCLAAMAAAARAVQATAAGKQLQHLILSHTPFAHLNLCLWRRCCALHGYMCSISARVQPWWWRWDRACSCPAMAVCGGRANPRTQALSSPIHTTRQSGVSSPVRTTWQLDSPLLSWARGWKQGYCGHFRRKKLTMKTERV